MQEENMFGKIRGRFDEEKARADVRTLLDQFIWAFAAMSDEIKTEAIARFDEMNRSRFKGDRGYAIREYSL